MSQWKVDKDDLVFDKKIGKGNFGEVWAGEYLGTKVAIKKLFFVNDELMQKYIEREMDTLTNLAHPNIVQFMGLCIELEDIFIITEFVSGGDLRTLLKDGSDLPWEKRLAIARDLAAAMNYLHTKNIVHRDLKSHNLLIGEGFKVEVCDFGLARPMDKNSGESTANYMTIVGTNEWMAPEVMLGLDYDHKCDVFSYAMVLFELMVRDKPPQRSVGNKFAFDGPKFKSKIPSETPPELWELLVECSAYNPEERPEFKMIIRRLSDMIKSYTEKGWPVVAEKKSSRSKKSSHKHKKSSDGHKHKKSSKRTHKKKSDGETRKHKKKSEGHKHKKKTDPSAKRSHKKKT